MLSASDLEAIKKLQSKFKLLTQEITEFYLHPFDGTPKANLYDGKLERVSHGAMHVNRTAGLVKPIWKFYCWLGDKDALNLSEEEIFLLQIVVWLHDKERKNDGKDLWEKQSQAFCEQFLVDNGISHPTARRFAFLIRQKEKGGILGEIFQTGDALDIMRNKKTLILKKVSLYYNCKDRPQAMRALVPFVVEIRALIAQQYDLKYACEIKIDEDSDPLVLSISATRDDNHLRLKVAYEHAKNCYEKVTADFAKYPMIQALSTGNFQSNFILKTPPEQETLKDVFFAKSIRGGQYCFIKEMMDDLTQHESFSIDVERRLADKREWMVVPEGVVKTAEKLPIYSQEEKKYFSSINSWTLITTKGIVPIFNFDKSEKLAGCIVKPASILLYYLSIYDNGTVGRPNHFDGETEAWNYYEKRVLGNSPKLYPRRLIKKFIEQVENSKQYNEVSLRAKLSQDFNIGIFANNLSSRLLARYYQRVAMRALQYLFKEKDIKNLKVFYIPIRFYLPNDTQNWQIYSALEEIKDDELAAATWKDEKLRNEQFANNNFEFLLFGNSIEDVLEKTFYKGIPILLYILRQGYIHIAEELLQKISAERVHYHLSRLIPYLNKKTLFSILTNEQTYQEPAMPYLGLQKDHSLWIWFKQQGANIHSVDADGNTALLKAAIAGKAEQAAYLLEQGLNVNHQNFKGETALHCFVRWKQKAMTEKLLKMGAKVDIQDHDTKTPLQMAITKNYFELIKLLVETGKADINKPGKDRWTALHYAIYENNLDLLKYLIAMKGDPHRLAANGQSLLFIAAQSSLIIVQYLVEEQKLDVNHEDGIDTTALHIAAENGQFAIVKYLIEQGADYNKKLRENRSNYSAFEGWTAVNFAVRASHYEIAKYLLIQHGAKFGNDTDNIFKFLKWAINCDDLFLIQYMADKAKIDIYIKRQNESALDLAVFQALHAKPNSVTNFNVIKYLLRKKIYLSMNTCDTLVNIALENDDGELLQQLLNHDMFFIYKPSTDLRNILDQALNKEKYEIVKFLHRDKYVYHHFDRKLVFSLMKFSIKNDDAELFQLLELDIKRIIIDGYNPIYFVAEHGSIEIMSHLIGAKVNINSTDQKGSTALHYAASAGKLEMVRYLHQKGAELGILNNDGASALHQAIIQSQYEVIKYLAAYFSDDQLRKHLQQIDLQKVPQLKAFLRSIPRMEKIYLEISEEKMTQLPLMTNLLMQQSEVFHTDTNHLKLEEEDELKAEEIDKSTLEILPKIFR